MNAIEHLLVCLGEEGCEIAQDTAKSVRFGLDDVKFLNPDGPSNRERLINELNDLCGVVELLVDYDVIPPDWWSREKIEAKKAKVRTWMEYAIKVGALEVKS